MPFDRSDQYRNDAPLRAWLRRILRNLATDRARRSTHEVLVDDEEASWPDGEYTVDPASAVTSAATREELEDADRGSASTLRDARCTTPDSTGSSSQ